MASAAALALAMALAYIEPLAQEIWLVIVIVNYLSLLWIEHLELQFDPIRFS